MSALGIRGLTYEDGRIILPQWQVNPIINVQVNPMVLNTWYPVIPQTSDAVVMYVQVQNNNNPYSMEVRSTIDGVARGSAFIAAGIIMWLNVSDSADNLNTSVARIPFMIDEFLPAQDVSMDYRVVAPTPGGTIGRSIVRLGQL